MTARIPARLAIAVLLAALAVATAGCNQTTANQGTVGDASGTTAPAAAEQTKPQPEVPTWGKRYTWSDGLAVEVSPPVACKPSEFAQPQGVQRAVKFTVLIINDTDEPFDAAMLTIGGDAQFAGKKADPVFDSGGGCGEGGMASATVLPGKTYTYDVAYSVGPAAGEMQLVFEPDFGGDKAVFVGQA